MSDQQEIQTRLAVCDEAKDLEKALECEELESVLKGGMGSFSIRYWFINTYNNYINCKASNPCFGSTPANNDVYNREYVLDIIRQIIRGKRCEPIDILLISRDRQVEIKTREGYIKSDYIFYSVIRELSKKKPELRVYLHIFGENDRRYEHIKPSDLLRSAWIGVVTSLKWRRHRNRILNHLRLHNCVNSEIWAMRFFSIRWLIGHALIGYSLNNVIKSSNPRVILSNDDSVYTKPLNDRDRKFIVLQSARMVEYAEDCSRLIFKEEPDLMPDLFLASGEYFAEIKKRYNMAKKVVVVGLPRYDVLFEPESIYSKAEFLRRFGIESGQKVVLWSTQCQAFSDEENSLNIRSLFSSLTRLKGVVLIVKQHPAESQRYTDLLNQHIEKYGIKAWLAPKNSDTYELLFACDLMITRHSTTAMEAVALNRPVIVLNLSGEPDPVEYVNEGVALGVYEEQDIGPAIQRLLEDDSDLAANRMVYINKYLYRIDGKATQRVVDIIDNMLDERLS